MHRLKVAAIVFPVVVVGLGCRDRLLPSAPRDAGSPRVASSRDHQKTEATHLIGIHDACDPKTFNKAVGPGTCERRGQPGERVTFQEFVEELSEEHHIHQWRFDPAELEHARPGGVLTAHNVGGEVHTFTPVAHFGGGIVPFLNDLAQTPVVAPECQQLAPDDFVPPNGNYTNTLSAQGTQRFQCCIHPWMHVTTEVEPD